MICFLPGTVFAGIWYCWAAWILRQAGGLRGGFATFAETRHAENRIILQSSRESGAARIYSEIHYMCHEDYGAARGGREDEIWRGAMGRDGL